MRFAIIVHDLAADELAALRVYDSRRIVDAIRNNLADQASIGTRNRKRLDATVPSFEPWRQFGNSASAISLSCCAKA